MGIALGNIFPGRSQGDDIPYARYIPLLGDEVCNALFHDNKAIVFSDGYRSKIIKGKINGKRDTPPYKRCSEYLDTACAQVFSKIMNYWTNSGLRVENPRDIAEEMLTSTDGDTLKENCHELYAWLMDAVHCGSKYLLEVFTVLTVLAITRGCWPKTAHQLFSHSELLPRVYGLPHRKFWGSGNIDINSPDDKSDKLKSAFILQKRATQAENFHQARELLIEAGEIVAGTIETTSDDYCLSQLMDWKQEIFRQLMQESFKADRNDIINTLPALKDITELYGEACWQLFLDDKTDTQYLSKALAAKNPEAMLFLMKVLLPLESEETVNLPKLPKWDKAYGLKLAYDLTTMHVSQSVKGEAFYRLYLYEGEDEEYLRQANNCGAPEEAVKLYSAHIVSYKSSRKKGIMSIPGCCVINTHNTRTLALTETLPDNWQLSENLDALKNNEAVMCLLCKDDAKENFKDLVSILDELTHKEFSCAMLFILGSEELLTPLVDTALNQWHAVPDRPMLRVQVIDEGKDAAQHLLAMHPIFYPSLRQGKNSVKFVIVGNGSSTPHLKREAEWLLSSWGKIESASSDKDIIKLIDSGESLYFAVDKGNTLENMSVAIHIRELIIRHWVREGTAIEPPDFPIAFYCESDDADLAFLGSRTVVLGEEFGSNFCNNYGLIPYHARYFDWDSLTCDILDRLALCVHMLYWQIQPGSDNDESTYRAAYCDYARRTYNRDSSMGVVLSTPYRVWQIAPSSVDRWDVKRPFLSEQNMAILSENPALVNIKAYSEVLALLHREIDNWARKLKEETIPQSAAGTLQALLPYIEAMQCFMNDLKAGLDNLSAEKIAEILDKADWLKEERKKISTGDSDSAPGYEIEDVEKIAWVKMQGLAGTVRNLQDMIDSFAEEEHKRWNIFMQSRGWETASPEEAGKYINACGQKKPRHQLYIARLHPCITGFFHLDTLAEKLEPYLGTRKPFKDNDRLIIFSTSELLKESCFEASHHTAQIVRQLYGKQEQQS